MFEESLATIVNVRGNQYFLNSSDVNNGFQGFLEHSPRLPNGCQCFVGAFCDVRVGSHCRLVAGNNRNRRIARACASVRACARARSQLARMRARGRLGGRALTCVCLRALNRVHACPRACACACMQDCAVRNLCTILSQHRCNEVTLLTTFGRSKY